MDQFQRWRGADGKTYTDDYFVYNVGPGANGAAGSLATTVTANSNLNIQADSNFEWWATSWSGNKNGETEEWPDNVQCPITLLITDGGSGRNLFNQAMPLTMFAGLGREPYPVPKKRIFMGKSTVNFFWTNFSANTWDNISISLHGRKIFELN